MSKLILKAIATPVNSLIIKKHMNSKDLEKSELKRNHLVLIQILSDSRWNWKSSPQ